MNNRSTNDASGNTRSDHDLETPQRALAIGFLPAGLPAHLTPYWGIRSASCADELGSYGEGRALATGPSGPPIRPLTEAELAAQAQAVNFNPYHDSLGRFTFSDGVEGGKNDGLDGQGGGETKPASIAQHTYPRDKQNYARCALYSLQTIIAAKTGKEAPSEAEVQARFEAEAAKLGLDPVKWGQGTYIRDGEYAKIVQNVLKGYGIDSSATFQYKSPQDLANAIIAAKGEPAMVNIALAGHEGAEEHSVAVQWEPSATDASKGMFRVNNIAGMGGSKLFSKDDFAAGRIYSDVKPNRSAQDTRTRGFSVDRGYVLVNAKP